MKIMVKKLNLIEIFNIQRKRVSFDVLALGKVTWHEYATLYIKFHNMNTSNIQDFYNITSILNISDPNCKSIDFQLKVKVLILFIFCFYV